MKNGRKLRWFLLLAFFTIFLFPHSLLAQEDKTELILRVLPDYYYNNQVTPGKGKTFFLELKNNGSRALANIKLRAEAPEGWLVEFKPDVLPALGAGSTWTADVTINPPRGTRKGDYNVTLIAEANGIKTVTGVFLRVEGGFSYLAWAGIGVAVLVVALFIVIFLRSSRQ